MSRIVPLNALKAGINRLRIKGGADPSTLYDLVNGYVTIDGSVQSRPGTIDEVTLPTGTKGLTAFDGGLVVFSNTVTDIVEDGYSCAVLVHPDDATLGIKEIWFAAPFMGYLYVVAEFDNGDVHHYWLQKGETWAADTAYSAGDIVEPTTPNGLAYVAERASNAYPSWTPGAPRAENDIIEPTAYNGFYYTAVETDGTNPASGTTEPVWPTSEGAQVIEDAEGGDTTSAPTPPPAPTAPGRNPKTIDRYGNFSDRAPPVVPE